MLLQITKTKTFYGACDVAGGAGSVNSLPTAGSARLAPSFDAATPKNVTALVGKSAYLSCRVRNLGNRTMKDLRRSVRVSAALPPSMKVADIAAKGRRRKSAGVSANVPFTAPPHLINGRQCYKYEIINILVR
ncbi:unnamed protein product [Pieris macdunnoughi]|uniref:Uncharacterized protein n=1 Tax=Pieris macdunnoughi TaxID=345717 RepID=A0A821Y983_9NEOP|nr:unnamed protein product [Pieris macdunnoughi]